MRANLEALEASFVPALPRMRTLQCMHDHQRAKNRYLTRLPLYSSFSFKELAGDAIRKLTIDTAERVSKVFSEYDRIVVSRLLTAV